MSKRKTRWFKLIGQKNDPAGSVSKLSDDAFTKPLFEQLEERSYLTATINLGAANLYQADGSTALPLGSTVVVLVDANDNGFGDLTAATSTFLGDANDVVLARFATDDSAGPGSVAFPIVADVNGLTGHNMMLVWYNTPYSANASGPGAGVEFGTYRTDSVQDFSSIAWVVPADQANDSLNFLTQDQGGANAESAGTANMTTSSGSNTAPVIEDQTLGKINENASNGASVGTVIATDADMDSLTYSITAGNTGSAFAINASTGEITVNDHTAIDYDNATSFTLTVQVDDGTDTDTGLVTINVVPIDTKDFNGDGKNDIVYRNQNNGLNVVWYMDNGSKTGSGGLNTVADTNWVIGAVGDLNKDTHPDLVWHNTSNGQNLIWLMNGTTRTSVVGLPAVTPTFDLVGTGDFNADGNLDLVWRNNFNGGNLVWTMNGTTKIGALGLPAVPNTQWDIVGVADLNEDDKPDLLWRNQTTGGNLAWLMDGNTRSSTIGIPPANGNWQIAGLFDSNTDGKADILWRNTMTGATVIWNYDGAGSRSSVTGSVSVNAVWQAVV